MLRSIGWAVLLCLGVDTALASAAVPVTLKLAMPESCFRQYFQGPRDEAKTVSFALLYHPEAPERERFSLDDVTFAPNEALQAKELESGREIIGKMFYNGVCVTVRIAGEGLEKYAVNMEFCCAFPQKSLIFRDSNALTVTVADGEIVDWQVVSGITGGSSALVIDQRGGNLTMPYVCMAVECGADVNSALKGAVMADRVEVVAYLLDHGAEVNRADEKGYTPLHWAAMRSNRAELVQLLLARGANPDAVDGDGNNALIWAARTRRREAIIRVLAERTQDLNRKSATGFSAMGEVAVYADIELLRYLIDRGAKPELGTVNWEPVINDPPRLRFLLENGAVAPDEDSSKRAELMFVALAFNLESARYLHSLGWEWRNLAIGKEGFSPLFAAVVYDRPENLCFLMDELGYDINAQDTRRGDTPLMYAVRKKSLPMVKLLLENGADTACKNHAGQSVFDMEPTPEIRQLLQAER